MGCDVSILSRDVEMRLEGREKKKRKVGLGKEWEKKRKKERARARVGAEYSIRRVAEELASCQTECAGENKEKRRQV